MLFSEYDRQRLLSPFELTLHHTGVLNGCLEASPGRLRLIAWRAMKANILHPP